MTANPAQPDFDDDPVVHAWRRIIDAAEDYYPPGDELRSATLLEISDLNAVQRGNVISWLASTVSMLFARERPPRASKSDARVMDRAVRGIITAAQNYCDVATFDESFRLWTDALTRHQLAKVTATLAVQLVCFYQSDPMSERGSELVTLLEKWLAEPPAHGDRDETR